MCEDFLRQVHRTSSYAVWSYKVVKPRFLLLSCHSESWIHQREIFPWLSHLLVWSKEWDTWIGMGSAFWGCCGNHIPVLWARYQTKLGTQKMDGSSTNTRRWCHKTENTIQLFQKMTVAVIPPRKIWTLTFKLVKITNCSSCWGSSWVAWGREFCCWFCQESSLISILMFQTTCWSHSVSHEVCRES